MNKEQETRLRAIASAFPESVAQRDPSGLPLSFDAELVAWLIEKLAEKSLVENHNKKELISIINNLKDALQQSSEGSDGPWHAFGDVLELATNTSDEIAVECLFGLKTELSLLSILPKFRKKP